MAEWSDWIAHNEDACPVNYETFVEVVTSLGVLPARRARELNWTSYRDFPIIAYRIMREQDRETATIYGRHGEWGERRFSDDTHRITYDLIDGEPDCGSIRMEKINDH